MLGLGGTGFADQQPGESNNDPVVKVGNVVITALARAEWSEQISRECSRKRGSGQRPTLYTSANGNVLSRYARSLSFREKFQRFDYVDADGMPLVWASRWFTQTPIPERCATSDFYYDIAEKFQAEGKSIYLLGGSEETIQRTARKTRQLYPNLRIAGYRNGYFGEGDEASIVQDINEAAPDILFVGLGVPKEHDFVLRNCDSLTSVGVVKTCGGLFDFVSGKNPRAPQWMQDLSLEWAYRVWNEPTRLFWRYLTTNVHAMWLLARHTADMR